MPADLADISALVGAGQPASESVRTLLRRFGFERRGYHRVRHIRRALENAGLKTRPDFDTVPLDFPITFEKAPLAEPSAVEAPAESSTGVFLDDPGAETVAADPAYRLTRLEDLAQHLISVKPDDTIDQALTIMLERDLSQLPVMPTERTVKGVVSWRTIGLSYGLGGTPSHVRDAMETEYVELEEASPLFAAIPRIVAKDYALVRRSNGTFWIITTSDLSVRFKELTEPFLLLSEIENQLRILLNDRVSKSSLVGAKDPADEERIIESAADLTLGEVIRVLEQPEVWKQLAPKLNRVAVIARLHRIRSIRNDVMHFDPEGIGPSDLEALHSFAKFLRDFRRWAPRPVRNVSSEA